MDKTKFCGNCKFYKQHYYWHNGGLNKASSGHCTNYRLGRLVYYSGCCVKWELAECERIPPDSSIEKILRQMAKTVEDIATVLKCDN